MSTIKKIKSIVKRALYKVTKEDSPMQIALNEGYYNPYEGMKLLKDIKVTLIDKDYEVINQEPFSLITPVKNEADDIILYLNSIENQKLLPDEVIIVDGGSNDGTPSIIRDFAMNSKVKFKVIEINSKSISEQRNLAIKEAQNELIVMADAGNILDENYTKNMVGTLMEFPDAELVGSIFYAVDEKFADHFIYGWDGFGDWQNYLPAGKTMAVRRSIFLSMGGFPEFLSFTGEDALFDIFYRNISTRWVFNKAAFVYWDIPRTWEDCLKKFYSYGVGAGENHMGDSGYYVRQVKMRQGIYAPDSIPITDQMYSGYLFGREKRAEIEFNVRNVNNLIVIFSKNQLHVDSAAWQKVKEYIQNNNKVIFISHLRQFPAEKHVDFDFTLLELYDFRSGFSIEDLLRRYGRFVSKMKIEILGDNEVFESTANVIRNWREHK
ncbi:glycosyltransferase [Paenibacillus amylolyticus]|uniref:glycosyltransferase n=1 Tax=Paenibacillus amylolyticus TaxID=1451 RepID=UPI003D2E6184